MFGSFVTVRAFENRPSFSQCSRCLRLGHSVDRCNRPSSLVVYPHCGRLHTALQHPFRCLTSSNHRGRPCSCPPRCFLCIEKKMKGKGEGHNALSHPCPLHSQFRAPHPSPPSGTDPEGDVRIPDAQAPSVPAPAAETSAMPASEDLTPTPGAEGPFTVVPENRSAVLIALHQQGANMEEMCHALLTPQQIADLSALAK
jgi:hypothetical protein